MSIKLNRLSLTKLEGLHWNFHYSVYNDYNAFTSTLLSGDSLVLTEDGRVTVNGSLRVGDGFKELYTHLMISYRGSELNELSQ